MPVQHGAGEGASARGRRASHRRRLAVAALALPLGLAPAACKPQNKYVAPPPPQVTVAPPQQRAISRYVIGTGNLVPVNQVDLVARVQGFLQEIRYQDGATVKKGDTLFVIEPLPYQVSLQQEQADQAAKEADAKNAEAVYGRQSKLVLTDDTSRAKAESAQYDRDAKNAALLAAKAAVGTAAIQLSYTQVNAPFDGEVSAHLVSIGTVVGGSTLTKLATITQMDPIWVTFTLSEQDVLRVRESLRRRDIKDVDLSKVPVEIGLQTEAGFPHVGHLDYVSPTLDPSTGTITVRGVFANAGKILLPGYYARARVPIERDAQALLVPQAAIGSDQLGATLLVVNAQDVVELRHVGLGDISGDMQEIATGLKPDERVVIDGLQRAVPGEKVAPVVQTAAAR